ncbi:hypothetical protein PHMEG_0007267 [Phytophthora megakarya]|uniref:Uncharacterized protein n=1 Tax=Phytophthora megakarya TaxID=4795 RepID=A0A225WLS9_9STRA|nr:hypothetical protein PHMEG_0007267 [Phytophthora megakarya]
MAEDWQGEDYYSSYPANTYDATAYDGYYPQENTYADGGYDPDEYWRVDADVYRIFLEMAPNAQGESVELGELPELCRQVGRPLRDVHEQFNLMQELDTTNSMVILRHDFVTWLLNEIHAEELARINAAPRHVPVATPSWEEVVQEVAEADAILGNRPTAYYYNTLSATQKEVQVSRDGVPDFVNEDDKDSDAAREMIQQLRELFVKYDDDKHGHLDPAEFEDLCVHVGQAVNGRDGLLALMLEVDPYSSPVVLSEQSEQQPVVSWEALKHYWITNAPFQRRTRLGEPQYVSWERVDLLNQRITPALFRHTTTLQERWGHPAMEQRIADRLNHLFPSSKLDWTLKIDLFLDVQWQQQQKRERSTESVVKKRLWSLKTCWRAFAQFDHPMSRRGHVLAVMEQLDARFGTPVKESEETLTLDEAVVRAWLAYCTKKVDMGGWEEVMDSEGQTYYYHEVNGITQWDPPQLQTQMATMLTKLGGGQQNLSADEQIARVFRQFDADESGEMTIDEFQHFYRALLGRGSSALSDAQIKQVFSVLDASGDGSVTLEEFQFWWKTKLQLEIKETNEVETIRRGERRRGICREFLENADAITLVPRSEGPNGPVDGTEECFESNLLPRLVDLLGDFPLRGLVYRRALNELVADPMEQLVSLERFLEWYDRFETTEREKLELRRAKQRAQAELRAQHEAQAAAREKQRRRRKQMRTMNVINEQAAAITEYEAQLQREKKIAVLFKTFDTDGSGLLDENELQKLTKSLGHDMDAVQVGRMMKAIDSSGDGRINLEEFLTFWKAFEHRRPAAANAATLHQTRRDAVSTPAISTETAPTAQHLSTNDAIASLAVSLEMVKDRALKVTLDDLRGFLSDWRDDFLEKRLEQQAEHDDEETIKKLREMRTFIPTKKRVYGAKRLDVTWIEPEVVDCVAAIIADIGVYYDPPLKPDAAQRIQALVRGHLARKHVLDLVCNRFQQHVDPQTRLFYFTDTLTGKILLKRPLYPTDTSSVAPLERDDCTTKADKYQFDKRMSELRAKKSFHDQLCLPSLTLSNKRPEESSNDTFVYQHRPVLAPSAFYMYDVTSRVQQRLLGNIWTPLRSKDLILVELIARRRHRQLMQRGSDVAANLPLHYAVRHSQFTVTVIRAIVNGYPEALAECDAFGMTPLHIAFREQQQVHTSVWERRTVCGDTPLHTAILHRASVGVLQWAISACAGQIKTLVPKLFNKRGESAFHSCITQQQHRQTSEFPESGNFTSPRSRSAVDNNDKDLGAGWLWLVDLLLTYYPAAVLTPKRSNGLLPVHLAIKYGFPEELSVKIFKLTAKTLLKSRQNSPDKEQALMTTTTIAGTRTTLLHYALLHQPQATSLLLLLINCMPTSCSTSSLSTGDLPVHVAAAAHGLDMNVLHKLCDVNNDGCRAYNHKRHLPLHVAIVHDVNAVQKVAVLLPHCQEKILSDPEERRGLQAMVMAANATIPDYRVLLTLLDAIPGRKFASVPHKGKSLPQSVTPFYALSLRHCTPEITNQDVAKRCHDNFEDLEDEEAYFLAMAKAKLRRQHYNPTPKWTFAKILELVERNPLDEALIQRALHAMNEKLRAMGDADNQDSNRNGYGLVVETVTLNSDLMLVRTVHQTMYEFPSNPRLQLLGQAILSKLLPSAYVRAAYKAKIDPYFNL